jgi:hypothetical protein
MPFYKCADGELLEAPNFVSGPGFELLAGKHQDYTYPVDGWYWFSAQKKAIEALGCEPAKDPEPDERELRRLEREERAALRRAEHIGRKRDKP